MSKNIKLIIEVPVNEIRTSKCGNYVNLPESVQINNIEGLSNVEAYIYRSRLVIKKSGAINNKKAATADNNRIENLEASVGKLAEMMAILVKQNKAKTKA
jgi:hypothetical protein